MSIVILKAGLQTTLQGQPRTGLRHVGVPFAGPADPLSMSLANRLVGNPETATTIETTLTGVIVLFNQPMAFAVTGAESDIHLNGSKKFAHKTLFAEAGDMLELGPCQSGCRNYIALSGVLKAQEFLGATSTYLPAGFGGFEGRVLRDGDEIEVSSVRIPEETETPKHLRPYLNDRTSLQVVRGPNFGLLEDQAGLFLETYKVSNRSSRMGAQLEGKIVKLHGGEGLPSSAVFPGTVQCPPDGKPFILMCDAQTTGGYPHILQVIRSDRYQLGQLRPGSTVRFIERSLDFAHQAYRQRWETYSNWLSSPVI